MVANSRRQLRPAALASEEATKTFLKLLKATKTASASDIKAVIEDKKNKEALAQLMDVFGYSGSKAAFDVVTETEIESDDDLERYFWALAQSANPEVATIKSKLIIFS